MYDYPRGRQLGLTRYQAARSIANHRYFGGSMRKAQAFIEEEEIDSGIIVVRSGRVEFWHPTFQEFLTARALAPHTKRRREVLLGRPRNVLKPEWRGVILFLAHLSCGQGFESVDELVKLLREVRAADLLETVLLELKPLHYIPETLEVLTARRHK